MLSNNKKYINKSVRKVSVLLGGKKAQQACGRVYCRPLGKMPLVPTREHNLSFHLLVFLFMSHTNTHSCTVPLTHRLSECVRQRKREAADCPNCPNKSH